MTRRVIMIFSFGIGVLIIPFWFWYMITGTSALTDTRWLRYVTGHGAKTVVGDFVLFGIFVYYWPRVSAYFKAK